MSKIDDSTRLRHMLEAAKEACEMVNGESREALNHDRKLALALVRLIEIVGEAAANVSKEKQLILIDIPWRDVIGILNGIGFMPVLTSTPSNKLRLICLPAMWNLYKRSLSDRIFLSRSWSPV
ncbi:HepT-like ribonuclease domain-containing protein [Phormidesmis priestleyi]